MEKLGIFIFANIVDPCSSVLKKQTTHKTKFYSSGYTQTTKQCLESIMLSHLKLVN